jgi:hypothetical protein
MWRVEGQRPNNLEEKPTQELAEVQKKLRYNLFLARCEAKEKPDQYTQTEA